MRTRFVSVRWRFQLYWKCHKYKIHVSTRFELIKCVCPAKSIRANYNNRDIICIRQVARWRVLSTALPLHLCNAQVSIHLRSVSASCSAMCPHLHICECYKLRTDSRTSPQMNAMDGSLTMHANGPTRVCALCERAHVRGYFIESIIHKISRHELAEASQRRAGFRCSSYPHHSSNCTSPPPNKLSVRVRCGCAALFYHWGDNIGKRVLNTHTHTHWKRGWTPFLGQDY